MNMEWNDQSVLEVRSALDVEDSSMDTEGMPGGGDVCIKLNIQTVQTVQTVWCEDEKYVDDNTYGLSECGKNYMKWSAQPLNIIHTVQSGGEKNKNIHGLSSDKP
jgi:hypothetical protein